MLCFKFHQNRTINEKVDFFEGGAAYTERGLCRGQNREGGGTYKMKTYKMHSQNKSMINKSKIYDK